MIFSLVKISPVRYIARMTDARKITVLSSETKERCTLPLVIGFKIPVSIGMIKMTAMATVIMLMLLRSNP
jgi:hypothetical protein